MTREPLAEHEASPSAWYTLAILTLVTFYIFLDRQVFVLLAEPIRKQLALSDFQLGLLQGVGLAVFAAIASYPIGWLADRRDRRRVLAGCTLIWCLAVIGCGLAETFPQLFLAGAIVGIGEAGMTPIVYAWIPELFRGNTRVLANSIFAIAGRLGIGLAIALVGYVIFLVDDMRDFLPAGLRELDTWRLTFFAIALPGPIFMVLVLALKRQQPISATPLADTDLAPSRTKPSITAHVGAHRSAFVTFYLGIGFAVFGLAAAGVWVPVVAIRQFGATPAEVGAALGPISIVASLIGLLFTIYGTRLARPLLGERMPVLVIAFSCVTGALTLGLLMFATSTRTLFVLYGIHLVLVVSGNMLYPTALQEMAPASLRARMVALMSIVLLAFGATAPALVGLTSDWLAHFANGLLLATVSLGAIGLLAAGVLTLVCARSYAAAVRAAQAMV
jgi:Major Facilitator Superfamily